MIYRFVIISNEVKDFRRDLRISGTVTFATLHESLAEALGYDPKEPAVFRITDERWNPETDIYLYDMGYGSSDEDVRVMSDTYLDEFLDTEKQRLLYTFDLVGNRSLYMKLREITLGEDLPKAEVVRSGGVPPAQVTNIEDFLSATPVTKTTTNTEEDEYGFSSEGGYNEEDLSDLDITTEEDL